MAEFKQGHQFLKKREQHLLDQLATLEQLLTEGREKFKTRGVSELDRLTLVISELEGKARQPAAELMQVRCLWAHHFCVTFEEIPPPRLSVLYEYVSLTLLVYSRDHISLNNDMTSLYRNNHYLQKKSRRKYHRTEGHASRHETSIESSR